MKRNKKIRYALFFIILIFTYSCASFKQNENQFYFVQITDTHFNEPGSKERIEKVIDAVNNLPMKIECVVHTGDITQEKFGKELVIKEYKELISNFNMPVYTLPGNHDIVWSNYDENKKSYLNHFDNLIHSVEIQGVVFIMLYTGPLAEKINDTTYFPLAQLESLLQRYKGKPAVIFHHAPSVEDFYRNKMHEGWQEEIRSEWIELLNNYDVKGVLTGHFHRDEHHWLGEIPLYVSAPVSSYWGRQLTYRIYEYRNGKISYRKQYLE